MGLLDFLKDAAKQAANAGVPEDGLGDRLIAAAMHLEMAVMAIESHPQYKHHKPDFDGFVLPLTKMSEEMYKLVSNYPVMSAEPAKEKK